MGIEADDVFDRAQRFADEGAAGTRRRPITVMQCCCGYPKCSDYWLVGIGKFVQGSGFTKDEAERIAGLINDADEA